jgi:hypothetical protein
MLAPLLELKARLLFDALERSFWNISLGVDNRYPSRLDGMLELLVAAGLRHLEPAILLKPADDFLAVHRGASFRFNSTHFVYTQQYWKMLRQEKRMIKYEIVYPYGELEL